MCPDIESVNHVFFVSLPWHPVEHVSKMTHLYTYFVNVCRQIITQRNILTCSEDFLLLLLQLGLDSPSQVYRTPEGIELGQVSIQIKEISHCIMKQIPDTKIY